MSRRLAFESCVGEYADGNRRSRDSIGYMLARRAAVTLGRSANAGISFTSVGRVITNEPQ
jgi:hypothetical protein